MTSTEYILNEVKVSASKKARCMCCLLAICIYPTEQSFNIFSIIRIIIISVTLRPQDFEDLEILADECLVMREVAFHCSAFCLRKPLKNFSLLEPVLFLQSCDSGCCLLAVDHDCYKAN